MSKSTKDQVEQIPKEKNYYGSPQFKGRTLFKVAIAGDIDTGKSTIEKQLTGQPVNNAPGGRYAGHSNLTLNINKQEVNVHFFDSLGQERCGKLPTAYYRSADFIFVVYDITSNVSFTNLVGWLAAAQQPQISTVTPNILIIGNKLDLVKDGSSGRERAITFEQAQKFANQKGLQYLEISAFKGDNCQSIKDHLTNYIQQKMNEQ
ncbi:hypothetical protein DFA_11884 [Cavenderia fasciculata]|uniref:Rab GTPase n=1 Tax=Cavenderia fasciculata TaxID=261658 RepID=F4QEK9_CACFS|nr:uncharacterized protein DFA_11884 [Cavenderia fasciculata]EGG14120.1 hypothetical protein DFA_11884 [Cavenderia fasciculata]|eukprot:XP_004350828.1 hypothetical protein DFA_11884 [Cavenderia fasciculata]